MVLMFCTNNLQSQFNALFCSKNFQLWPLYIIQMWNSAKRFPLKQTDIAEGIREICIIPPLPYFSIERLKSHETCSIAILVVEFLVWNCELLKIGWFNFFHPFFPEQIIRSSIFFWPLSWTGFEPNTNIYGWIVSF